MCIINGRRLRTKGDNLRLFPEEQAFLADQERYMTGFGGQDAIVTAVLRGGPDLQRASPSSGGTPFVFLCASLLRIACFHVVCLIFSVLLAGGISLFFYLVGVSHTV